jgi:hypothetical protein
MRKLLCGVSVATALALAGSAAAGVSVNIGIPAPPAIVIPAPPRLVIVPGLPVVQYAPDVEFNYFSYGGRYYTMHEGSWFVASAYNGPWVYEAHPPREVLRVPVRYYHVPPGHRRHEEEHHHGHGNGHEHHDHD